MEKFWKALEEAGGVTDEEMIEFNLGGPLTVNELLGMQRSPENETQH